MKDKLDMFFWGLGFYTGRDKNEKVFYIATTAVDHFAYVDFR